jgi:hypothetical protein
MVVKKRVGIVTACTILSRVVCCNFFGKLAKYLKFDQFRLRLMLCGANSIPRIVLSTQLELLRPQ